MKIDIYEPQASTNAWALKKPLLTLLAEAEKMQEKWKEKRDRKLGRKETRNFIRFIS